MDLFVEKWEAVAAQTGVNIIRIHALENEKDMVDAFYNYLLGIDTPNHDIPIIFETIFHDEHQYTTALLDELKEMIDLWNNADRSELSIETKNLDWSPDLQLKVNGNPTKLFVENLNSLATHLQLPKGIFLVVILKASFVESKRFCGWLEHAVEAGMDDKFKIIIDDSVAHPFYNDFADKHPGSVTTLKPDLNMDKAMEQVAAMGNPNDAAVQYRQAFLRMTQGIEQRNEKETKKYAAICIEIAEKNLEKNVYWIGQVIAVYAALANDQVGYKNFKKAIEFATSGVEVAERAKELITDEFIYRKFYAQAIMMRASLYAANKSWQKAIDDFDIACEHYFYTNDVILAMEACRMTGYCHKKSGNNDAACKALTDALTFVQDMPKDIIRYTTFPGIIELLLQINNQKYITNDEVHETARSVYGNDWLKEILNWKNPHYEQVSDPTKVMI
ncbi:hypothetical protein QTN47_11530 [Danxiaibacter flavus]|uniref:Tetratricopeptide repeat protein n=1 Tax=Danxiaibacter flavus TaxID=3049108 RepID=A0ABV3ZE30_9BACT|nr:hypothetical protein QNM32_11535 [Chitinophagaceae bacterium DXS]